MAVSHSPGLLLLGFFREPQALLILNYLCVCPDTRRHALQATCVEARRTRGGPVAKAGSAKVLDMPPEIAGYAAQVAALDRLRAGVEGMAFEVQMVEVRPLIAIQAGVFLARVAEIEAVLGPEPSPQTLAEVCLPLELKFDLGDVTQIDISKLPMRLQTRNPNIDLKWGVGNPDPVTGALPMAFLVGAREPCIQVIEFEGRYHLRNGFHRAVAAMHKGVSHVPALVMHAASWANIHADLGKGWLFDARGLREQSPTLGHFETAYRIPLRMWEFDYEFSVKVVPRGV